MTPADRILLLDAASALCAEADVIRSSNEEGPGEYSWSAEERRLVMRYERLAKRLWKIAGLKRKGSKS